MSRRLKECLEGILHVPFAVVRLFSIRFSENWSSRFFGTLYLGKKHGNTITIFRFSRSSGLKHRW
jgi:hypothetical protein